MNGIRSSVPPTLRTLALLLMVLMVGVVMLSAQTKSTAPAKKKTNKAAHTETYNPSAGQKAYKDPVTGEIRQPTPEEAQALDAAGQQKTSKKSLAKTAAAPQENLVSADGAIGLTLSDESMAYSVATKSPDGKVTIGCLDGKTKAESAVKSNSKPATAKSVKAEVADEK
jgi:hypothetical protein